MNTIKINYAADCVKEFSSFGVLGGEPFCGELVFNCIVEVRCADSDEDLWEHKFSAEIYLHGHGSYVADGAPVWSKSAIAYVAGAEAMNLHAALRPFLFDCVVDAFVAGHHIVGSYEYDGREWNLHPLDEPIEALELPEGFTP